MATTGVIRPISPDFTTQRRRRTLIKQQLSVDCATEKGPNCFSLSLPSPITREELGNLIENSKIMERSKVIKQNETESENKSGVLQHSPSNVSIQKMRPRSASLFSSTTANPSNNSGTLGKKRSSIRGLSRSRPSSARQGGWGRSELLNYEQEAGTYKVDTAFAKIKAQLANLSEQDQAIEERLDKLGNEINYLIKIQKSAQLQLHPIRTSSNQYPVKYNSQNVDRVQSKPQKTLSSSELSSKVHHMQIPTVMVSNSQTEEILPMDDCGSFEDNAANEQCISINVPIVTVASTERSSMLFGSCGSVDSKMSESNSMTEETPASCCILPDHETCPVQLHSPVRFTFNEDDVFLMC